MRKTIPELIDEVPADEQQKEAIEAVIRAINSSSDSRGSAATVQALSQSHRTLQQSFMRTVIIPAIHYFAWAKENERIDARNEDSAILCEELKKILDEKGDYVALI